MRNADKCHQLKPLLSMYMDGETSSEQAALLLQHLSNCHKCASEMTAFYQTSQALKSWSDVQLSDEVVRQMLKKRTTLNLIGTVRANLTIPICIAASIAILLIFTSIICLPYSNFYNSYSYKLDKPDNIESKNSKNIRVPDIVPVEFISISEISGLEYNNNSGNRSYSQDYN